MVGQAEVVVRAEVDDGLAAYRRVKPARLERPKIGIDLLGLGVAHPLQLSVRLF
jgi:hypothetical protein